MIVLQHILVLFLVIGMPLWDRYEIPRLKASTEPRKKVRYYRKIVFALWICALIAVLTTGFLTTFSIKTRPGEIGWLQSDSRAVTIVEGITVGMLIAIFLPAIFALWNDKLRAKAGRAAKKLAFLLPSGKEERRWWWLVCITAGVCEELVYRGFLVHYLHTFPFHVTLTLALIMASVVFGIGHLYQGWLGAVQTALIGFIFGVMFVVTGNLLLPMAVHAALDLRVLAMLPEGFDAATDNLSPVRPG
jgi:membrane protease YdiL (CAAX protease family)